jgi:hypothetical protein
MEICEAIGTLSITTKCNGMISFLLLLFTLLGRQSLHRKFGGIKTGLEVAEKFLS